MLEGIQLLVKKATSEIQAAEDLQAVNDYKVLYLGKKGKLTEYLKQLGSLSNEERPKAGQVINQAKQALQEIFNQKINEIKLEQVNEKLAQETIDVTLPGRGEKPGSLHPISISRSRIEKIFSQMGFAIVEGPEIEDDYHNFEALNIPKYHPARAMQDTFYLEDKKYLLRTHMSPVQIRTMETTRPPLKIIAPGRVYRCDFDMTHTPMFHQVEGLYVDKNVSFANMKSIMHEFLNAFFEQKVEIRFRSSYFPFTEPSAELDMRCVHCKGDGCRVCSHTGWLEVVGCGMVHPNVLKAVDVDPEEYTGFAFGFGYDRLTMLYNNVNDLRTFFENDMRFLEQF